MTRWLFISMGLTLAACAACLYIFFFQRDLILEQVPIHWDIHMEPDGFVPREEALFYFLLFPGIMALMIALTLALPWLSPRNFQVDSKLLGYIMMLVVGLFGYLCLLQLWASLGGAPALGRLFVGGFFLFFALLGNVLGKVQRNFWVGVRTPWTLASETVWVRTHRLAGWLFLAAGVVGFAAVMAGVPFWICFVGFLMLALYPVLYSLILYKRLERQGKL